MTSNNPSGPYLINLSRFLDHRGKLSVVEQCKDIPFHIHRVYWVYDVPEGAGRGAHAHHRLYQLIVAVSGSFSVTVDDGFRQHTFLLDRPDIGLVVMPGIWVSLHHFSPGAVCMVLASDSYDEDDYIRDYSEFLSLKNNKTSEK